MGTIYSILAHADRHVDALLQYIPLGVPLHTHHLTQRDRVVGIEISGCQGTRVIMTVYNM